MGSRTPSPGAGPSGFSFAGENVPVKSKAERFQQVATKRVNRVLKDLRLLRKCANRASYEYTQEEVVRMLGAIYAEEGFLEVAFKSNEQADFSFDKKGPADAEHGVEKR
jgi:hypothetical protein